MLINDIYTHDSRKLLYTIGSGKKTYYRRKAEKLVQDDFRVARSCPKDIFVGGGEKNKPEC